MSQEIRLTRRAAALALRLTVALSAVFLFSAGLEAQAGPSKGADKSDVDEIKRILESTGANAPGGQQRAPVVGLPALRPPQEEPKSDPAAGEIIERYLQAIGGRDVLAAVNDRITKFRNIKYSATGETKAVLGLYMKRGYKYREEWLIEGFKIGKDPLAFVQIYNGDLEEGWVQMFDTVSLLEGRTLGVFVWDKYIDDFFVSWDKDGFTATLAGQGLVDDEPADIVQIVDFSRRHRVRYFFAKKTGLLVKKEWIDTATKEPAKKEQFYRKYTRVAFSDGSKGAIRFPLHHEIMVDGDLDTERLYTAVRFNGGLDEALFAKPAGVPFEERMRQKEQERLEKAREAAATGSPATAGHGQRGSTPTVRKVEGSDTRRPPLRKTTTHPPKKVPDASKAN
ncbi:MAG: hypothetical protein O7J95_11435 [Planctomycetota bacterium]|nr:hypothetical protein [Planctomycetota bacterium]